LETPSRPPPATPGRVARWRWSDPAAWLGALVVIAALAHAWDYSRHFDAFDFYQFWVVGRAAAERGTGDVWSQGERERLGREGQAAALADLNQRGEGVAARHASAAVRRPVLETYSTPWLYALAGAAASGDYGRDVDRFQFASLAALALGVWWMARAAGLSPLAAALLIALAAGWFEPVQSDARVGNVNRLQVGVLGAYVALACGARFLRWRELAAGAVLGLGAAFKPNLAFPVLTLGLGWIALGRWSKVALQGAGAALGALLALALSSAWFGSPRAWSHWVASLGELMGEYEHTLEAGNFSLARVLEHAGAALDARVLAALGLAAFGGALVLRRRAGRTPERAVQIREDLLLLALGGALSVLAARLAWTHYFLLALPLGIVAVRPAAADAVRAVGALGLLALAIEPLRAVFQIEAPAALASLACGGAALLYCAGLYDLAAPRREAAS
jgi:hypothetical protein